jgi:hypothetical protein
MRKFFVGQRVKTVFAVHPSFIPFVGRESVIVAESPVWPGCWILDFDVPGTITSSWHPDSLEPIIDRHTPCESEFKESLDKLLERVTEERV